MRSGARGVGSLGELVLRDNLWQQARQFVVTDQGSRRSELTGPVIIGLLGIVGAVLSAVLLVVGPTLISSMNDPASSTSDVDRVAVQNVYNIPEARALEVLRAQGFTKLRVWPVCSGTVPEGRVREVLLDKNARPSDETSLVNELGQTGIEVPLVTKLVVKVATGPCP